MKLIEFKRKLDEVTRVGVLLSTMEPVNLTRETAAGIVESALLSTPEARDAGFSGVIFVALVPIPESDESVMLIGIPSNWESAQEVTL